MLHSCWASTVPAAPLLAAQAPGTWHLRTTILPPEEDMQEFGEAIARFHRGFLERYAASSSGR